MTTIINIKTSTYQLPLSFRWVLVLPCLLVMVSGCRSAVTTQASVALNTYQTAQTMPAGGFGFRVIGPSFGSSIGGMLKKPDYVFVGEQATMYNQGLDFEIGLGKGWNIGAMVRTDANLLDGSLVFRPYVKTRVTENNTSFVASIFCGGEIITGSASNSSQISNYSTSFVPSPIIPINVDSAITTSSYSLGSNAWRVFVAVPMNFLLTPSIYAISVTDIILQPGLNYLNHDIIRNKVTTVQKAVLSGQTQTISQQSISEIIIKGFLIPSLSLSMRKRDDDFAIQPELTLAIAGENVLWNLGISFQFGKFGE